MYGIWIQLVVLMMASVCSLGLTGAVRSYALAHRVIDRPTERSSHKLDTPTGGGIGLVLAFMLGLFCFWLMGYVSQQDMLVLVPAGGLLSLIGAWDDHSPLSPITRLFVQFGCCGWVVFGYGVQSLVDGIVFQVFLAIAFMLAMVWLANLYNFMDGIDGIASVEAITVIAGWCVVASLLGDVDILVPSLLAASVLGFLFWNFPPAKIFMGDSGSVFIGFVLGVFAVKHSLINSDILYIWAILLGVFVVDASITLSRRLARGENPLAPHRTHTYQIAAQVLKSHKRVTLRVGAINLLWLLPLAIIVTMKFIPGWVGLLIAYAPLMLVVLLVGGGGKRLRLR